MRSTSTTRVYRSGWPTTASTRNIPNSAFLGDLVAGGDPSQNGTGASGYYITRTYSATTGWGDVSTADVLVTDQWDQFGSALTAIALADCGGTLTVQTRDQAGDPADADVTYQVDDKTVTTTRIAKAGTFDIPLNGVASTEVVLLPQSLDGTGYTAQSWSCRAGGANLVAGTDYHLVDARQPDGRHRGHRQRQRRRVVHAPGEPLMVRPTEAPGDGTTGRSFRSCWC